MLELTADKTERLDKFLAGEIPDVSRVRIQKAIRNGQITVNSKQISEKDFILSAGDTVKLPEFEQQKLKAISYKLIVVFENEDLAVIDKPAGLMVHPAAGKKADTLAAALLTRFPGIEKVGDAHRPGIVHRLDEDTSGLLVIAKTPEAYEYLKKLFKERDDVEKEYLALVHGKMEQLHGLIDAPIGKSPTGQKMRVGTGKSAATEYSVLTEGERGVDRYSLLVVKLHTGRTHQIRVHLAHIGHPVAGDKIYGGKFKQTDARFVPRQFLHAYKLKLKLPDGTWLELVSELPPDLKSVLRRLDIKLPVSS